MILILNFQKKAAKLDKSHAGSMHKCIGSESADENLFP